MKNIGVMREELADRLALPDELSLGAAKLTVTAGRRVIVENHRGILKYGDGYIAVKLCRGKLIVTGAELRLMAMNQGQLLIFGRVKSVEWE